MSDKPSLISRLSSELLRGTDSGSDYGASRDAEMAPPATPLSLAPPATPMARPGGNVATRLTAPPASSPPAHPPNIFALAEPLAPSGRWLAEESVHVFHPAESEESEGSDSDEEAVQEQAGRQGGSRAARSDGGKTSEDVKEEDQGAVPTREKLPPPRAKPAEARKSRSFSDAIKASIFISRMRSALSTRTSDKAASAAQRAPTTPTPSTPTRFSPARELTEDELERIKLDNSIAYLKTLATEIEQHRAMCRRAGLFRPRQRVM